MRPFKEVILFNNVDSIATGSNKYKLFFTDNGDTSKNNYKLKKSGVQVIWSGSIEKFKKDFEIPEDAPLSTKETKLPNGDNGRFVDYWDWTTLNFKFNYQVWFKDSNGNGYFVLGSNNSINLTIPNVLVFNGNSSNNDYIQYDSNNGNTLNRPYNPNLFPMPISITSFVTSNRINDFQNVQTNNNVDSIIYLAFRYGVNNNDIEICLLTKDSSNFQINNRSLCIPYASLTFTGFNKIKRLT